MKLRSHDRRHGIFSVRAVFALAVAVFIPLLVYAGAPAWWAQRGVLVSGANANDYAPANQGQLKNIAKAAMAEMDAKLPGGAGAAVHNLVDAWSSPAPQTDDYAPVNLGQLKNVAKPFYDRLISAGLVAAYPWAGSTNPPNDFQVANIGQVKNLFSFELPALDPLYDGDNNGLPDAWERQYFGATGVDPNGDPDGDGVLNSQEYANGTNPTDYYDGVLPVLSVVSGNNQQGSPNNFLPLPLVIQVTDGVGNPLNNAPVTFAVTAGGGLLASNPNSSQNTTLELRTGTTGGVSVYYRQPNVAEVVSQITATVSTAGNNTAFSFTATTTAMPTLTVTPERLEEVVNAGQIVSRTATVTNNSSEPREVTVTARGTDAGNLIMSDSDQGNGPQFVWNDIADTGTHLSAISDADDNFQSFNISFEFPYFGENYHTVYVSSNGFITFGAGSTNYHSYFLPHPSAPANMIAAFENDLDLGVSGDVYYQENGDNVIIQFDHVAHYGGEGRFTFQIVLKQDGTIFFYYKEMAGFVAGATVGVQDSTRTKGLTIAYQQPYLKDNLAVRITNDARWLDVLPTSSFVAPGETADFIVTLDAREFTGGGFNGALDVTTDHPVDPVVTIPVTMSLNDDGYFDSDNDGLTNGEERALDSNPYNPDTDGDGMSDGWEVNHSLDPVTNDTSADPDGDGLSNLGEFSADTDPFNWDTDDDGLSDGDEVQIYHTNPHLRDSDGDEMSDLYEANHGLDPLHDDTAADLDGDGLSNIDEFNLGTNPASADTDADGMPDGWEVQFGLSPWSNDGDGDFDGDGQTNLAEFQNGNDPSDFFNGMPPVITIVQGGTQSGTAGNYSYTPITVEVRNSDGVLLANAPVTFTLTQGSGTLSDTRTANPPPNVTSLSLRADANGRAYAYFMSTGPVGSTYQVAVNAGHAPPPGDGTGPVATGSNLDPNGNEDGDGKTNDEEGKLGTNPTGFTLFAETHYPGHAETPHTEANPLPWVFYTETLTAAPEAWAGMSYKAAVVFDTVGTQNNWVVDDYASINNQQFVALGHELIYDVSDKWNATGPNTFTATSDVHGGVYCAPFKIILGLDLPTELVTPAGDPVGAPVSGGDGSGAVPDGANEFTYSTGSTGVLTLKLKARVKDVSTLGEGILDKFRFEVDAVGTAAMMWDAANPGGKPTANGNVLTATVTFTGLPSSNSAFGKKNARVIIDGHKVVEATYEVFFPRDAKNHPAPDAGFSPNWFYYWNQTAAGYANAVYLNAPNEYGETPAMRDWSPTMTWDKREIWISDAARTTSTRRDGSFQTVTGIDLFANVVRHEVRHTEQISEADAALGALNGQPGTIWEKGWSWNKGVSSHNHYNLGADGGAGVAGTDDDGDGVTDEVNDRSEVGRGGSDDTHLDSNFDDIFDSFSYTHIETDAENREVVAEGSHIQDDWGSPGKQHKTGNHED